MIQERTGEAGIADRNGRIIQNRIPPPIAGFLQAQRLIVLATRNDVGERWASVLFGEPPFVGAEGDAALTIDRGRLVGGTVPELATGDDVGVLAVDLATRRRVRVNGKVAASAPDELRLEVGEVYPNCPKYIQRRRFLAESPGRPAGDPPARTEGTLLDAPRRALIAQADTAFVASGHPTRGADASHRGGNPGFVVALSDRLLRIPDYAGNGMYNTLGNLAVDDRAGLTVVDFAGRRLLRMTGRARILFDEPDPGERTGGTGRFWELEVLRWVEEALPPAADWHFVDASPFNPA